MAGRIYIAKFDYQNPYDGEELNMLSFQQGDQFLYVDSLTEDWVALKRIESGEIGLVPSSYVEPKFGEKTKRQKLTPRMRSVSEGWHSDVFDGDCADVNEKVSNQGRIARDINIASKGGNLLSKTPEWKKALLLKQRRTHSVDEETIDKELSAKLNAMAHRLAEAAKTEEEEKTKPEFMKINLKKVDRIYYK